MIRQIFLTETGIMFSARGLRRLGLDLDPNTFCPILSRPPALDVPADVFIKKTPRFYRGREPEAQIEEEAEANLSEQEIELGDALSPIYDQLKQFPLWWILELLPFTHIHQRDDNSWTRFYAWNLGRGRRIPRQNLYGVKVHRSVKTRLEASYADKKKYSPKAKLHLDKIIWVD